MRLFKHLQTNFLQAEISEQIDMVVQLVPEWCTISSYPDGSKVMRLNRAINLTSVLEKIK
jgi:hypothetical protein